MRKMIQLTKLDTRTEQRVAAADEYAATDDVGENVGATQEQPQPETTAVSINTDAIRCFYARRNNAPGTRITFTDGGGFVVTESYDDVKSAIETALAA